MKKLLTVLCFGLAALARADAPTALTVPDSTPLFSWADPYALGRGFYLDGAFFAVTNNPDITLTTSNFVVRVMGTGAVDPLARAAASNAQATAAFAYSPTNVPPALTNYLFAAIYTNGAWWAVKIAPTP